MVNRIIVCKSEYDVLIVVVISATNSAVPPKVRVVRGHFINQVIHGFGVYKDNDYDVYFDWDAL